CLCHRLVQGWRADTGKGLQEKVQAWIAEQFAQCHLTSEELATAVFEQAARVLERPPDQEVEAALEVYRKGQARDLGRNRKVAAEAIAAVEQLVGAPTGHGAALRETLEQAASALASPLEARLA